MFTNHVYFKLLPTVLLVTGGSRPRSVLEQTVVNSISPGGKEAASLQVKADNTVIDSSRSFSSLSEKSNRLSMVAAYHADGKEVARSGMQYSSGDLIRDLKLDPNDSVLRQRLADYIVKQVHGPCVKDKHYFKLVPLPPIMHNIEEILKRYREILAGHQFTGIDARVDRFRIKLANENIERQDTYQKLLSAYDNCTLDEDIQYVVDSVMRFLKSKPLGDIRPSDAPTRRILEMAPNRCGMTEEQAVRNLVPELRLLFYLFFDPHGPLIGFTQAEAATRSQWGPLGGALDFAETENGLPMVYQSLLRVDNSQSEFFSHSYPILWSGIDPSDEFFRIVKKLMNGYVLKDTPLGRQYDNIWGDASLQEGDKAAQRISWRSPSMWFVRAFRNSPRVENDRQQYDDKPLIFVFVDKRLDHLDNTRYESEAFTSFTLYESPTLQAMIQSSALQDPWNPFLVLFRMGEGADKSDCSGFQGTLCARYYPRTDWKTCKEHRTVCINCWSGSNETKRILGCVLYALTHELKPHGRLMMRLMTQKGQNELDAWLHKELGQETAAYVKDHDIQSEYKLRQCELVDKIGTPDSYPSYLQRGGEKIANISLENFEEYFPVDTPVITYR